MKSSIITPTEHEIALIVSRRAIIDSPWFPKLLNVLNILIALGLLWAVYVGDSTDLEWLCVALILLLSHINVILHYRNLIRFMASCRNLEFPIDAKQFSEVRYRRAMKLVIIGTPIAIVILIMLFG